MTFSNNPESALAKAGAKVTMFRQRMNGAGHGPDGWPPLDLTILGAGRMAPPAFPLHAFGPLAQCVADLAEAKGAPADYVAAGVLAGAAAPIGNARWVEAYPGWREPCALWVGLVGEPSAGKSPSLDPALDILRDLEAKAAGGHATRLREWETLREAARLIEEGWLDDVKTALSQGAPPPTKPEAAAAPEEPARPRRIMGDATPEAIGAALAGNPKGVLLHRDELAGLIGGIDRYARGGGGREMLLESFGGRRFVIDRKSRRDPLVVDRLLVSIVGGIQPEKLRAVLEDAADGLAARFIWIWPTPQPPRRPADYFTAEPLARGFAALDALALDEATDDAGITIRRPRIVRLDPAAQDVFEALRQRLFLISAGASGPLAHHIGKLPGIALRGALVLASLDAAAAGGAPPDHIDASTMERVAGFVERYLLPMARRVYGDAGAPAGDRDAATLARAIIARGEIAVNARIIYREWGLPNLRDGPAVQRAAERLIEGSWIRPAPSPGGRGRKALEYDVNPAAFGPAAEAAAAASR